MSPIVFLHIPKTAGQTVHHELVRVVGGEGHVSPIRVHSQAGSAPQMPAGYRLYSGHIDWTELENLPVERFVFTVLRDPRERLASFYLYLREKAERLSATQLDGPEHLGLRRARDWSADEYFFGGDAAWQRFILDHYDNFYTAYFSTRRIRGRHDISGLDPALVRRRALAGLAVLDAVYDTTSLRRLEDDIEMRYGKKIRVAGNFKNASALGRLESRWDRLASLFERPESIDRLEAYVTADEALLAHHASAAKVA